VKLLVDQIKMTTPEVIESANFEVRPWGRFEILKEENYFKSKVIQVKPGQRISYQSHQFRAEHWIVVKGTATVILNDEEKVVKQGQHIFIPQGAKHRIVNSTNSMVEFIEVQVGVSFAEDDITRYQDDYGR
jgi:mannose-6-phosphate isomerase-like protein (cupin superfamily)